jgi:hypothetical protein
MSIGIMYYMHTTYVNKGIMETQYLPALSSLKLQKRILILLDILVHVKICW